MKNTHVNDVISRNSLSTINISDNLNSFRSLSDLRDCYVVDEDNVLKGRINNRRLLEFMGPSLMVVDATQRKSFMDRVLTMTMDDVMEYSPVALTEDSEFSQILCSLNDAEQDALPVVDGTGRLIGEVSCDSILSYLDEKDGSAGILKAV